MKKGKILGLGLALVLAVSNLAACGEAKVEGNATQTTTAAAGTTAAATTAAKAADPLAGFKQVELVYYGGGSGQPAETNLVEEAMNKILTEKIKATIKLNFIPWGDYSKKMNVIAASGDAFDICFSADWQQYMPMVSRGAYAELDDLMAEYGKEYIAQMPSTVIEAAKYKGKMFAAPNLQGLATSSKIFVNSEIFDKYKLPASITKLDDLDPFMEAIKNGEPGMTPLYSYTGGDAAAFTYYLFNQSQGLFNINGAPVGCYDSSFKVVNQYTTDRAKEFYAWARKANQKGWISKSAATQKDDPNLMKSRKFAMQLGYSNPQYDANNWTNILPVTMKTIDIAGMDPVIQTSNCRSTMYSISAGSDSKEQAMMYINLINTDKVLYNTLCYGVEGKHYVLKDGFVELPEGLTAEKSGYNPGTNWSFGYTYNAYLAKGTDPSVGERQLAFDKAAKGEPAMGFVFDSTPIKTEVANCQSVIDEYAAALEMGVSDPEKTLATFVEKLNAAGAEKIIAEKQKQLDQWRVDNGK